MPFVFLEPVTSWGVAINQLMETWNHGKSIHEKLRQQWYLIGMADLFMLI